MPYLQVAVLTAHTGMITGVNFCPAVIGDKHYLASTSSDCSVAFWSYTCGPDGSVLFQLVYYKKYMHMYIVKVLKYNEYLCVMRDRRERMSVCMQ